jgi:hypothetical protein
MHRLLCHSAREARRQESARCEARGSDLGGASCFVSAINAPERLPLPGGRKAKITYAKSDEPFLAARIQDLYGVVRRRPIIRSGWTKSGPPQ